MKKELIKFELFYTAIYYGPNSGGSRKKNPAKYQGIFGLKNCIR
jgi:hypothetical protein